ncbi:MAG: ORF6N domain-containing protein [Comamonadaceae bacterium]|nr:MAG: ORF6N domain-containing protein [Comamonadaceae bacterium]
MAEKPAALDASVLAALSDAEGKIYVLRGLKTMLAQGLTVLFGTATGATVASVRKNLSRLAKKFIFFHTNQYVAALRSQIVILNNVPERHGRSMHWHRMTTKLFATFFTAIHQLMDEPKPGAYSGRGIGFTKED